MGGRWTWVVLALCGCKPKGVLVEVPGDHVELFIASTDAPCTTDNGSAATLCPMSPPSLTQPGQPSTPPRMAKRWILNTDDLVTAERQVTDGVTQFLIPPDAADTTIPALLAVSFDGPTTNALVTGMLVVHDVDVRPGAQERLQLVLDPFAPLTATGERMQLWRKPSDSQPSTNATVAPCALVGHGDGANYPFESFSPASDTDCDETEKVHDCDKFAAFSATAPTDNQLGCFLPTAVAGPRICMIGGIGCTDGAPVNTCAAPPETFCTSTAICVDATNANCNTIDCVSPQVIQQVNQLKYGLHCTYNYDASGAACAPSSSFMMHVTPVLSQLQCDDAQISIAQDPLHFGSNVQFPNGFKISVAPVTKVDCSISLAVNAPPNTASTYLTYVAIQVTGSTTHHHVIPVVIESSEGCAGLPMTCDPVVVPDVMDAITQCK